MREIKYNRFTKDYDLYLNSVYVGSAKTYQDGETRLDEIVLSQLTH